MKLLRAHVGWVLSSVGGSSGIVEVSRQTTTFTWKLAEEAPKIIETSVGGLRAGFVHLLVEV
jgi:hypothetical protein